MSITLDKRQPQSGYTFCACRDCMDVTVSSDTSKPDLCLPCQEAGCEAYAPDSADYNALPAHMRECQRDDAYGEERLCLGDHDEDTDCLYCAIVAEVDADGEA